MRYMNEKNTDEYYKILYKARYYYTQMNVTSPERFYKLIKELEDVRWNGSIIQPIEFKCYFPSYALMEKDQFQYYIFWRTHALEGDVMACDASYFYVFIYELLASVHSSSTEGVYQLLFRTFEKYRIIDRKVDKYLITWILDYSLINGMFLEKKKELDSLANENLEIWNQDYKILNNDYSNCFEAVMRSSAYKLDKKSSFYLSRKDARIIDEVFDKAFYAINDCMKAHNLILSEFIVGKKSRVRWRIYQSTPWEGKLSLFTDRVRYQHSFNFAGMNYEYNPKEHTWDKDAISKEGKISGGQMVPGRIYLYHNGEFIAYLVKVIENICRKKAEYKRALKPNYKKEYGTLRLNELVQSGEIERVVEDVIDTYIHETGFVFEEIPVPTPKVISKKEEIQEETETKNLPYYKTVEEVLENYDNQYLDYEVDVHSYIQGIKIAEREVIDYSEPNTNITKFKKNMKEYADLLGKIKPYEGSYEEDGMILYYFLNSEESREFVLLKQISEDSRGYSLWVDLIKKGTIIFPNKSVNALILMHQIGNADIIENKEWLLVVMTKLWNHYYPDFQREEVLMWIRDYWITYCPNITYEEFKKLFAYQIYFEGDKPQKAINEIDMTDLLENHYLLFFSKNADYRIGKGPTATVDEKGDILEKCLKETVAKLKSMFAIHGFNLDDYWKTIDYEISEKRREPFKRMILSENTLFNIAEAFQSRKITEFETISIEFNRIQREMKYVLLRKRKTYFKSRFFIETIGKICELYLRDWLGLNANFKIDINKMCTYYPEIEMLFETGELFDSIRRAVEEVCNRNNIQQSVMYRGSIEHLINYSKKFVIEMDDAKIEFENAMLYGHVDQSRIEEARQVLLTNQERLVIDDDDTEQLSVDVNEEVSSDSDIQTKILKLLIEPESGFAAAKQFADSKGVNIVLEIEKINEIALEELGDVLVDTDGMNYYVYDEYKEYIRKL
jgi:hypothetical protein